MGGLWLQFHPHVFSDQAYSRLGDFWGGGGIKVQRKGLG